MADRDNETTFWEDMRDFVSLDTLLAILAAAGLFILFVTLLAMTNNPQAIRFVEFVVGGPK